MSSYILDELPATILHQFDVLGLTPTLDKNAINKRYRKLALQYHPDKNKFVPKSAEEKFNTIANAKGEILTYFEEVQKAYRSFNPTVESPAGPSTSSSYKPDDVEFDFDTRLKQHYIQDLPFDIKKQLQEIFETPLQNLGGSDGSWDTIADNSWSNYKRLIAASNIETDFTTLVDSLMAQVKAMRIDKYSRTTCFYLKEIKQRADEIYRIYPTVLSCRQANLYRQKGHDCESNSKWRQAINFYTIAINVCLRYPNPSFDMHNHYVNRLKYKLCNRIGLNYSKLNDHTNAAIAYAESIKTAQVLDYPSDNYAIIVYNLATTYSLLKNWQRVIDTFLPVLHHFRNNDAQIYLNAFQHTIEACDAVGRYDIKLTLYADYFDFYQQLARQAECKEPCKYRFSQRASSSNSVSESYYNYGGTSLITIGAGSSRSSNYEPDEVFCYQQQYLSLHEQLKCLVKLNQLSQARELFGKHQAWFIDHIKHCDKKTEKTALQILTTQYDILYLLKQFSQFKTLFFQTELNWFKKHKRLAQSIIRCCKYASFSQVTPENIDKALCFATYLIKAAQGLFNINQPAFARSYYQQALAIFNGVDAAIKFNNRLIERGFKRETYVPRLQHLALRQIAGNLHKQCEDKINLIKQKCVTFLKLHQSSALLSPTTASHFFTAGKASNETIYYYLHSLATIYHQSCKEPVIINNKTVQEQTYQAALHYYNQAYLTYLKIATPSTTLITQARNLLNNLGDLCIFKHDALRAEYYYQMAYDFHKKHFADIESEGGLQYRLSQKCESARISHRLVESFKCNPNDHYYFPTSYLNDPRKFNLTPVAQITTPFLEMLYRDNELSQLLYSQDIGVQDNTDDQAIAATSS